MKAKFKVGDIVETNRLYQEDGRKLFSEAIGNVRFKGKIMTVYENTHDQKDEQGIIWQTFYKFPNGVRIAEKYLSLVSREQKNTPTTGAKNFADFCGKRIDVKALISFVSSGLNGDTLMSRVKSKDLMYAFDRYGDGFSLTMIYTIKGNSRHIGKYRSIECVREAVITLLKDAIINGVALDDIPGVIWSVTKNNKCVEEQEPVKKRRQAAVWVLIDLIERGRGFKLFYKDDTVLTYVKYIKGFGGVNERFAVHINTSGCTKNYEDREFLSCSFRGPAINLRTGEIDPYERLASWGTLTGACKAILQKYDAALEEYNAKVIKLITKHSNNNN